MIIINNINNDNVNNNNMIKCKIIMKINNENNK